MAAVTPSSPPSSPSRSWCALPAAGSVSTETLICRQSGGRLHRAGNCRRFGHPAATDRGEAQLDRSPPALFIRSPAPVAGLLNQRPVPSLVNLFLDPLLSDDPLYPVVRVHDRLLPLLSRVAVSLPAPLSASPLTGAFP